MSLAPSIAGLSEDFSIAIDSATSLKDLDDIQIKFLGKNGLLQALFKNLPGIAPEKRPEYGKTINILKKDFAGRLKQKIEEFEAKQRRIQLEEQAVDVTLPSRSYCRVGEHPLAVLLNRIEEIFSRLGFSAFTSPQVDSSYNNFWSLNFPKDHPALDLQDTFYIDKELLLRTHTSNFQNSALKNIDPPIRIMQAGRVFRNETVSARSHVVFHQIDGMYVSKETSLQDLIHTLKHFFSLLFSRKMVLRFRASYFPFVEPGLEVDMPCLSCDTAGCMLCKK